MPDITEEDFEEFRDYYLDSKQRIDHRIEEVLEEHEKFTKKRKLLAHAVEGGKRIRPVLTTLSGDIYDAPPDATLNHGLIVELIHNASLVIDDKVDDDDVRRGSPTTWRILEKLPGRTGARVNTAMTAAAQTGLMALALELADDPDVVRAMGRGTRHLTDGFFAEGKNILSGLLGGGYDQYIETNRAKTGWLFALSAWMPATYVDAPEEQEEAARKYGETTGLLYQVADDWVDEDLPSFIADPNEELEKWYDEAVGYIDQMPEAEQTHLAYVAPAWMVWRMVEDTHVEAAIDVDFIPVA